MKTQIMDTMKGCGTFSEESFEWALSIEEYFSTIDEWESFVKFGKRPIEDLIIALFFNNHNRQRDLTKVIKNIQKYKDCDITEIVKRASILDAWHYNFSDEIPEKLMNYLFNISNDMEDECLNLKHSHLDKKNLPYFLEALDFLDDDKINMALELFWISHEIIKPIWEHSTLERKKKLTSHIFEVACSSFWNTAETHSDILKMWIENHLQEIIDGEISEAEMLQCFELLEIETLTKVSVKTLLKLRDEINHNDLKDSI